MSNEELAILIRSGIDETENIQLLYEQTKNFIRKLAIPYQQHAEMDDLMQEGFLALYRAVMHFEPAENVPFIHYSSFWIKQGLQRYVDDCCRTVRIPVGTAASITKYNKLIKKYTVQYGKPLSDKEIAWFMGMSLEQIEQLKKDMNMSRITSLDKPIGEDADGTIR